MSETEKQKGGIVLASFIMLAIFLILIGKAFFVSHEYLLLYSYGVLVTAVLFGTFYYALFKYVDPAVTAQKEIDRSPDKDYPKPLVSCMVAVYNEEKFVEQCIESIANQTYAHKEVIFVNDCSTDNTAEILDYYAKHNVIRVIHLEKNAGKKRALGQAMQLAKGDIFAFSDSDSQWNPDALEKIVTIFRVYPNVGGVSGHGRALNSRKNLLTRIQDSWYEGQFGIRKAFESVFGAVTCVSGPLAVFRREAIFNYIPAWEQDAFLGQEFKFATDRTLTGFALAGNVVGKDLKSKHRDSLFVQKANYPERDWDIVYSRSARSLTIVPDSLLKVFKQQIRWKKSFIRNIFFTGKFYWHKPITPALFYYLHVLFVLVGPFIAFRHILYMPVRGDMLSPVLYIAGISFIGLMFGLAYKIQCDENDDIWIYRPLMSLLSTLVLSWLIFYAVFTIKKMVWYRG